MNNLYNVWIEHAKNGYENPSILLFCLEDKSMIKIIENEMNDISNVVLLPLTKITKEILNQRYNLIVYSIKEFSLGHLQIFANDEDIQILFTKILSRDINYHNKNHIQLQDLNNPRSHEKPIKRVSPSISHLKVDSFIYNYQDPIDGISTEGIKFLKQFIANFITNNSCTASKKSIQIFLYRNIKNISNETMLNDIEFLHHRTTLTSRLAIFIYKIFTFDYNASDKTIGLYFSKYYGRSRVVNGKSFGVENVKGYIIKDINFQEQQIRNDIANRLHKLRVSNDIIAQATGVQY